jgi:hypothetical protein
MDKVSPVVCGEAVARNLEHLRHILLIDCKAAVNTYYCCNIDSASAGLQFLCCDYQSFGALLEQVSGLLW